MLSNVTAGPAGRFVVQLTEMVEPALSDRAGYRLLFSRFKSIAGFQIQKVKLHLLFSLPDTENGYF